MPLRTLIATVAATIPAVLVVTSVAVAVAAPGFAPADEANIRPGSMTYTDGAQCTSNFVFYDSSNVYVGQAAHCAGTGGSTATNGCDAGSKPLGTKVEIEGASQPGTLVYSSWNTMQEVGETDENACEYNDFALVRIHPDDLDEVNPTIPFFGGPTGMTDSTQTGDRLQLRQLVTSPRRGRAQAEGGQEPRPGRRRLDPRRLYGDPGDPGRLG